MKTVKRLFIFVLCLLMAVGSVPFGTIATAATIVDSGTCGDQGDNVTWTLDSEGTLTIKGSGKMADYSDSSDPPWFAKSASVAKVSIESGVTSVGNYAFQYCINLTKASIPVSVLSVGDFAFFNCGNLPSIIIPDNVTSIGKSAFFGCSSLKAVAIGCSVTKIDERAFSGCSSLTEILIPDNVTSIGASVFFGCSLLKSVTIGSKVENIGNESFSGCSSLTAIIIPDSVKGIGASAFFDCSSLESISIGRGVTYISTKAFSGCSSLTEIIIPAGVKTIGESVLSGCSSLKSITIPFVGFGQDGNTYYPFGYLFGTSQYEKSIETKQYYYSSYTYKTYYIPESLKSVIVSSGNIVSYAFYNCKGLTNVTVPANASSVGAYAFYNCENLASITIPASLTRIENYTFYRCKNLTKVNIPDGVRSIGDSAFFGCSGLTDISIPANATSIGASAFNDCSSLKSISIPKGMVEISDSMFSGCLGLTSISIPDSVTTVCYSAFARCYSLEDVSYGGAADTWSKITNKGNNEWLFNAASEIHFNTTKLYFRVKYQKDLSIQNVPDPQEKLEGADLTLSSVKPTRTVKLYYDANGGSISLASKVLNYSFIKWNTESDGTGIAYSSGANYADDATVTLYAQWKNPTAGVLPSPTRTGYKFNGWYTAESGGRKVTSSTVITEDTTIYARWLKLYTVGYNANGGKDAPAAQTKVEGTALTLSKAKPKRSVALTYNANGGPSAPAAVTLNCTFNNWNTKADGSGKAYASGGTYTSDSAATLYAQWTNPTVGKLPTITCPGYTFVGWYTAADGGKKVDSSTVIKTDTTIYARWTPGKKPVAPLKPVKKGNVITFGGYPQSKVTDSALIRSLNSSVAENDWRSCGYYFGDGDFGTMQQGDWMQYCDLTLNGAKYRGVRFSKYRPYLTTDTPTADHTTQDDNGYVVAAETVYWFRWEPLCWKVLDASQGLVVSEKVIDAQAYSNTVFKKGEQFFSDLRLSSSANDYSSSSLRKWLNEDFYTQAFSVEEKQYICSVDVRNDRVVQSDSATDKIFLLSVTDVTNADYGFNRFATEVDSARYGIGTDYAFSQGLHKETVKSNGYSPWWLRTADAESYYAFCVKNDGPLKAREVNETRRGVRPAFLFKTGILNATNPTGGQKLSARKYSVAFDLCGGRNGPAAQTKTEKNALVLSSTKPTKSYMLTLNPNGGAVSTPSITLPCSFINWNTKADGTGTIYNPGANYTTDAALILYAQWTRPTAGNLPTPTRSGALFDGWYTSLTGGDKISSSSLISKDMTIYARWNYTISYDANGGSGAPASQRKTDGIALTLSDQQPTKTYTVSFYANGGSVSPSSKTVNCWFVEWNTKADGSGAAYHSGADYVENKGVTLYAQWTDPTVGELPSPTRSGYVFDGWYTSASGGNKVDSFVTIPDNAAVYAHWLKTYQVSYNANGGSGAPTRQTKTENKTLTLSNQKPTKSYTVTYNANGGSVSPSNKTVNCTFMHWNTKQDGSGTVYLSGAGYSENTDVTLYARWTYPTVGSLPTPDRFGYAFDGWYTSASGGNKVDSSVSVTDSVTVYAHWTKLTTYSVSYNANGGSGAPSQQTKTQGITLTLSSQNPKKIYNLTYNPNGGSVSPSSKTVSCAFVTWNTKADGSGKAYASGENYTTDANLTLYAQWTDPNVGSLPTPTRSGYFFDGWYTAASGGKNITSASVIASDTTIYAHWKKDEPEPPTGGFVWGRDNWNFINDSNTGDFTSGTYRSQISDKYLKKLAGSLNNTDYTAVFKGYYYYGRWNRAWLDDEFEGCCYGMSSTALLANAGLLPYSQYGSGASCLHDLQKPTKNKDVSSLIVYYQMLQVKDAIQQQYRTVPYRSNEANIKKILSLLDSNSVVLLGYMMDNWGAHAVLAYGYEYGSWTKNGVGYQGRIKICDPNSSTKDDSNYYIYFNANSYNWAIPAYTGLLSTKGARFNYMGANINEINDGGYLSGTSANRTTGYVARINAAAISANRSVSKVEPGNEGGYITKNSAPGDIIEDYSYVLSGESRGTIGYTLLDAESAYRVMQEEAVDMALSMNYENCMLTGSSAAGKSILFDKKGYVSVEGESAEYSISMTFNDGYPTDWFTIQVSGSGADNAVLKKAENGYVLNADHLQNVKVRANNREDEASAQFSTDYDSVLIYEIDKNTIGLRVDKDGDGEYETELDTSPVTPGDVNGDGKVNSSDARMALRTAARLETLDDRAFAAADTDGNGKVTSSDARKILRVAAKLESF